MSFGGRKPDTVSPYLTSRTCIIEQHTGMQHDENRLAGIVFFGLIFIALLHFFYYYTVT